MSFNVPVSTLLLSAAWYDRKTGISNLMIRQVFPKMYSTVTYVRLRYEKTFFSFQIKMFKKNRKIK